MLSGRNAADNGNIDLMGWGGASNRLDVGSTGVLGGVQIITAASTSIKMIVNATTRIEVNGTGMGFFAVTPVAQPADIVAFTDNTAGTPGNTLAALPNPADTPATADALRDDLVTNCWPVLRNWAASFATKHNDNRTKQRALGLMA